MPFILLTNDDGVDARGLPSFADALAEIGDLEIVVPDTERSWVGKAITRFDPVEVRRVEVAGRVFHTTTGYPADCVQLGVHALFEGRPDIVVSGINLGYNHGAAYLQSSGTVGAALEGAISGVPSVAFSMGTTGGSWPEWKRWAESEESLSTWRRTARLATSMVSTLLGSGASGAVSVGLPDDADESTPRRITTVAQVGYDRLFAQTEPNVFMHTFGGLVENGADMNGTDIEAATQGIIAVTPVGGTGYSEIGLALAEALLN
ncbi:MAG: 5'/3'-nucleotidase SurE [Acidimicrobiia bacterium]